MTNPGDIKENFYQNIHSLTTAVSKTDKLIILDDFNARFDTDQRIRDGVIGKNGIGRCNSNGLLLLQYCTAHGLLITTLLSASLLATGYHGCIHALGTWTTAYFNYN
ncbi:craniofacial development protein 2-like [Elysia marginata]|uniref:Craniofacial development protein 2-like n=1 Tax=Elysia marginata TaxID=1093978 RepID=A0AAV4HZC3_9GAST|nr:craniofacial development protein 2-like [Elysia marginata]